MSFFMMFSRLKTTLIGSVGMFQNNLNQQYQKLWPFRLTHLAHWYLFGEVSLGSICTFLQAFIIISKHIIFVLL